MVPQARVSEVGHFRGPPLRTHTHTQAKLHGWLPIPLVYDVQFLHFSIVTPDNFYLIRSIAVQSTSSKAPHPLANMSVPKGPFRLVTVNTAPERAKKLIGRVVEDLKESYTIQHIANCASRRCRIPRFLEPIKATKL
jgi:hypothetical protein